MTGFGACVVRGIIFELRSLVARSFKVKYIDIKVKLNIHVLISMSLLVVSFYLNFIPQRYSK